MKRSGIRCVFKGIRLVSNVGRGLTKGWLGFLGNILDNNVFVIVLMSVISVLFTVTSPSGVWLLVLGVCWASVMFVSTGFRCWWCLRVIAAACFAVGLVAVLMFNMGGELRNSKYSNFLNGDNRLIEVVGDRSEKENEVDVDVKALGVWSAVDRGELSGLIIFQYPYVQRLGFLYNNSLPNRGEIFVVNGFHRKNSLRNVRPSFVVVDLKFLFYKSKIFKILYQVKAFIENSIYSEIPEPEASLLVGILIGGNRFFPDYFMDAFRVTGTSHIISASGYNLTILLIGLEGLFRKLHRYIKIVIFIAFIIMYMFLAGLAIPIIRAGIMTIIMLISILLGQKVEISVVIAWSVFIMLIMDLNVLESVSFQLSLFSTLGLIYLYPILYSLSVKVFSRLPRRFIEARILKTLYKEYFLTTLSCTLFTLPIVGWHFKKVSILSVLVNILVLPVIEDVSLWGILGIVSQKFFPHGFNVFLLVSWTLLHYFQNVILLFSKFKFAYIYIKPSLITVYSLGLFLFLLYFYPKVSEYENFYTKIFK